MEHVFTRNITWETDLLKRSFSLGFFKENYNLSFEINVSSLIAGLLAFLMHNACGRGLENQKFRTIANT